MSHVPLKVLQAANLSMVTPNNVYEQTKVRPPANINLVVDQGETTCTNILVVDQCHALLLLSSQVAVLYMLDG